MKIITDHPLTHSNSQNVKLNLSVLLREDQSYDSFDEDDDSDTIPDSDSKQDYVARQETRAVNRSKVILYLSLLVIALVAGGLTFWFVHRDETRMFESEFESHSKEISETAFSNSNAIFGQLSALTTTLTSYAITFNGLPVNRSWPFVTLPNFDKRSFQTGQISGAELIIFSPIVSRDEKEAWEEYSWENQDWISKDLKYKGPDFPNPGNISRTIYSYEQAPPPKQTVDAVASGDRRHNRERRGLQEYSQGAISSLDGTMTTTTSDPEFYIPAWQFGPIPVDAQIINLDLHSHPVVRPLIDDEMVLRHRGMSRVTNVDFVYDYTFSSVTDVDLPYSFVVEPVFKDFFKNSAIVGMLFAVVKWDSFFRYLLPEGTNGIVVSISDTCGSSFTYMINGQQATYMGAGDLHDPSYDKYKHETVFEVDQAQGYVATPELAQICVYTIAVYPSEQFEGIFRSSKPTVFAVVVIIIFFSTSIVFFIYDFAVNKRNQKVLNAVKRTTAIVSSMFPKGVKDRILENVAEREEEDKSRQANRPNRRLFQLMAKSRSNFPDILEEDEESNNEVTIRGTTVYKSKPIADLFPEVTVLFADLVGFTAWSSTRDPVQVFTLLETIYHTFDKFAARRKVFKVETVGDCYVAVTGLPDPRPDHALVMARFARECLAAMKTLTEFLETTLGPETTDLGMRFGIHSGSVTAGVLRGERSRFQLFGDTMNTTARVETTGAKNKIHLSKETADLLIAAGKGHWLQAREDKVYAKGKGELVTYWLEPRRSSEAAKTSSSGGSVKELNNALDMTPHSSEQLNKILPPRIVRLVDWNKDILSKLIKEIVAMRESLFVQPDDEDELKQMEDELRFKGKIVLDEVEEIITLPPFNQRAEMAYEAASDVELSDKVVKQLRRFIETIALSYQDNAFHNFEHASHVTMSVVKLLSRIVMINRDAPDEHIDAEVLHEHTYGISSDPLMQFAVVFSAIIHDVDHPGVPNTQLVAEQTNVAKVYKNKSVAEQNSVCLAWDLLLDPSFYELRRTIYATKAEFKRFRQFVVNSVMATDVMDKGLNLLRKARWERAFSEESLDEMLETATNRKATIVIEHLIQASDVAHMMQHWHVYRKWNERFFTECRKAFREGRAGTDPAENWYKGEIGFFEFYIIPLAMKLKDCQVFGVASDEYLAYAQQNLGEWQKKGQAIVAEMVEEDNRKYGMIFNQVRIDI